MQNYSLMASKIRELPVREKREYGSSNEHDRVNNLSMDMNNERESRALLMLELYAKGYSQTEIASKLQISQPTVSKEMRYQIQCIYEHKQEWIQEMYEDDVRAKVGRRMMQRELWSMIEARADPKEKLVAFSLLDRIYCKTMEETVNRRTIRQWGHDAAIEAKAREQEEFEEFELLKCRSRLRYQKITTEILPAVRQASQVGNETVPVEKKENVRLVKKDKSVYQGEQRSKTRKSRF